MPVLVNGERKPSFDPDDVVISGMAGAFPESDSVKELGDQILNKVDLITDDDRRWTGEHPDIPKRGGRIKDITRFDHTFFGLPPYEVKGMDPIARMLLEKTFEAIYDAGIHPKEFEGTKTGVYIGSCILESEIEVTYNFPIQTGMGIKGCHRGLLGSRISNYLKISGPAYSVDTACSSSMFALEQAFKAIRTGVCDAAIVGAGCMCLQPMITMSFFKLGVLSPQGKCRCFDQNANGYVRSEAVGVLILQKAKDARRVYSQLVYAKTNCDGYKEYGITFPSAVQQKAVMKEVYVESGVSPKEVEYIEAHATGTVVGDPVELETIEEVLCGERDNALLVGSIKCNVGHAEPASGLCSIAKVVYAYNTGLIPPNIHITNLRDDVRSLVDGRMQVVQEPTPWNRGYSAISSFGFGGANAHILLKNIARLKGTSQSLKTQLPYLVCVSGRTLSSLTKVLTDIASRPLDVDQVALLHEFHKYNIPNHNFRGFAIFENRNGKTVTLSSTSRKYDLDVEKPIWIVFKGVGIQWTGIGTSMMDIPAFSDAIERCQDALQCNGLDVHGIVVRANQRTYSNIVEYIVGIVAIQIAMYDVIQTLDLNVTKFVGHGIGEIVCAYAAGCLSLEEAILTAYAIGKTLKDTRTTRACLADINFPASQTSGLCPKEVSVICENGPKWCTVAGPLKAVEEFVLRMCSVAGIGAKILKDVNVAIHTQYIADIERKLQRDLQQIIKHPKKRGSKWISTSVPANRTKIGELASPEYFIDMLLHPVKFEQAMSKVDYNTMVVSLLTNGMMSNILRSLLKQYGTYVSLTSENRPNAAHEFLNGIGNLYTEGAVPKLMKLYPKVEYPVAVDTPMLSQLVEWDHSMKWYIPTGTTQKIVKNGSADFCIDLEDNLFEFISGHGIDSRILFPATGYLLLAWQVFAGSNKCMFTNMSVVFEDIRLMRATSISKGVLVFFTVTLNRSGYFEILENETAVVSGRIRKLTKEDTIREDDPPIDKRELQLSTKDFYKELRLRGYKYSGMFQSVVGCNLDGNKAKVVFRDNWVTFLDALMQIRIVQRDTRGLFVPTRIEKVVIDTDYHYAKFPTTATNKYDVDVTYDPYLDVLRGGGVQMKGLDATAISRKSNLGVPVIERNVFVPYDSDEVMKVEDIIRANVQLMIESVATFKIKVLELMDDESHKLEKTPITPIILECVEDLPLMQPELVVLTREKMDLGPRIEVKVKNISDETNQLLFVGTNLLSRPQLMTKAFRTHGAKPGFVLSRETQKPVQEAHPDADILSCLYDGTEYFVLFKKLSAPVQATYLQIRTGDEEFKWIEELKNLMKEAKRIVLWAQNEPLSGLLGLYHCLRQEQSGCILNAIMIMTDNLAPFDPENPIYKQQMDKMLPVNIFKDGKWGSYKHLKMEILDKKEVEMAFVNVLCRGDLSSLSWIQSTLARPSHSEISKQVVHIYYAALNFRDIMTASGKLAVEAIVKGRLEQECVQGLEFSGKTECGDRVMGLTSYGALSNMIVAEKDIMWKVPDNWTLEEAATVPVVYSTVLYAFNLVGGLKAGSSVLIHAGSGGIGQAAINICMAQNCNIFTTVGTQEKRDFIIKCFPYIPESHIGNSRDTSFEDMINKETDGLGVDYVLNSLADEKLQASLRCVAPFGKFLEIGKFDMANNSLLGYSYFDKQRSFTSVMLDRLIDSTPQEKRDLRDMMYEYMAKGVVKPLTRTVFEKSEAQAAFRHMAQGKHIGKVLVKVREEEEDLKCPPVHRKIEAIPRFMCESDCVYIIVGGLGGFGLELADRLVLRGARRLVLTSRRGVANGYQLSRIRTWESYGVKVDVSTEDITNPDGCKNLLVNACTMGEVRAIFNLAVVLDDCLFENQSAQSFKTSFGPKAVATRYLDYFSRKLCPKLSEFVVFSSVSCGRGNAGQSNYGAANSVMERVCEIRAKDGLPAMAIQWGAVGDVGLVADMQEEQMELEIGGTLQQSILNCLDTLDQVLGRGEVIVSSMLVAEKKVSTGGGNLLDTIAAIIGVKDLKSISASTPLSELGLDSMTGVEIKQTLERDFEIFLSPHEIRNLTFGKLLELSEKDMSEKEIEEADILDLEMLLRNLSTIITSTEPIYIPETALEKEEYAASDLVFMLPGIDGTSNAIIDLCRKLKARIMILQLGYDAEETITTNAQRLAKLALSKLKEGDHFTLLAYSYGVIVSLEVASILEDNGYIGRVVCIDGSPRYLKNMLHANMGNEEQFQDSLITYLSGFIIVKEREKLLESLSGAHTWDDKLNVLIAHKHESVQIDTDFYRGICTILYRRMRLTNELNLEGLTRLKSQIQLVRPVLHPKPEISIDYELMLYTQEKVDVHYVDGANHVTVLEKPQTADILNDILNGTTTAKNTEE